MATLNVNDVTLSFGGLNALSEVSLSIEPGLITSIIGPNGAGQTSKLLLGSTAQYVILKAPCPVITAK
jgi:ABC-type branched-subunit amino acid transport system ATPase component